MGFTEAREALKKHFDKMAEEARELYVVDVDKDELYDRYQNSFLPGTNIVYRKRREHDCSACRSFIKELGPVVAIKDGAMESIWDVECPDQKYQHVFNCLSEWIKRHKIRDVYLSKGYRVGTIRDYEMSDTTGAIVAKWDHFYAYVPNKHKESNPVARNEAIARRRDDQHVFRRSLEEISVEATKTVLELISDGNLYRGDEAHHALVWFLKYQRAFCELAPEQKELFAWEQSAIAGPRISRIRNTSIGTLLVNISEGMDLDSAVRAYEAIVAPSNYKRPKALFTKKMLEDAKKTIDELGYGGSLRRRFARLDDISARNVLFANVDAAKRMSDTKDLFAEMEKDIKAKPQRFDRATEIGIDRFIKDVLPKSTSVELYLDNNLSGNMCSMIAPVDPEAPSMFKWDNAFSWAYSGNIADSDIKRNVEKAGGNVSGVLRFSIQWNDTGEWDKNDEDAHCLTPDGDHIYFGRKSGHKCGGCLDVDIINPGRDKPAVENIVFPSITNMKPGKYRFLVNCYTARGGKSGFRAEIEFDGVIYRYDYTTPLLQNQNVNVADVTLKDGKFSIKHALPVANEMSRELWGVKTNTFVPVTAITLSPNYWGDNGTGNKHYMFFLDGCVNPEEPNAWYNEYLKDELVRNHRKVFEALGSKAHVESAEDQLSGVGFSSTKRAEAVVRVRGAFERVLKVKF